MLCQAAMKVPIIIHHLSFTITLFAGIVVAPTEIELMAGQNASPWLQLTQPLEGGEGSDSDMSFASSAASSAIFTAQHSTTSLLDPEFESGSSTPIQPFPTHDTSSQILSFAEALHLTQIADHGTGATNNLNAETQPQYCSLDMLSKKAFSSRQGSVDEAEGFTSFDASETYGYYEQDSTDNLSSRKIFGTSSTLLLTYDQGDHFEPLQSIKGGLTSSRAQSIPLGPTETCIGDEDGSPCPSMIESDDSSVEDIEVRKAFACPYFRLDPVRHIECLSRKLYRIQDVKQHLSRRHYMARDKSSDASDNTRGVNTRTQSILKLRLDRRQSPERQWHEIWKALFDQKLPREGPYLGKSKEEIVGSMIAVCKQGSRRVVPGILRSLGLSNEKRKSVQQLMEQLLNGFQELSDERSKDMETEETEKASTGGGVDSMPMTPKDMEFEFDFNVPLQRSPSPEIQNSYSSKEITQMQESNSAIPTGLPNYTTFEGNGQDGILMGHQSTTQLKANVQVKPAWKPHPALDTLKTVEVSETAGASSNSKPDGKSLSDCAPVLDDRKYPGFWEYVDAWECNSCGFEYIFRPSGASSDILCINYPCPGRFPGYYGSAYKTWVRKEWGG